MSHATQALGSTLESLIADLDISPSKYKQAVDRYQAVSKWLAEGSSPIRHYQPELYPQGSFRLGTVIRPVVGGAEGDYDIDLACELQSHKGRFSAGALKQIVGDRLKEHGTYRGMLDTEGRRCWTLNYADESDGIGFHLDVLPAIPADGQDQLALIISNVPEQWAECAVAITERQSRGNHIWVPGGSNPRGYARWFDSKNGSAFQRVFFEQKRAILARNARLYARIEDVPDALVRTPLQRVIQLLKRHRDVRFTKHEWECEKPISIIITTLCTLAYDGQVDVESALEGVLSKISEYEVSGVIKRDGRGWVIQNPVNPGENLADRWNDSGSKRAEAFFEWIDWVRQDLAAVRQKAWEEDRRAALAESLGLDPGSPTGLRETGTPVFGHDVDVPDLGDTSHRQRPPWHMDIKHTVRISADVRPSVYASKTLWRLTGKPVFAGLGLVFHATTNAPAPYKVKWQVVNTGVAARRAGLAQLRGGFDDGEGEFGATRVESTKYHGTHTIEAFVIKDGVCVARSQPMNVRVSQ
ncbi:MAG: nucleotidyltransferase [Phycisphaerales bacterium JB060]